jgi:hypothetical protein
VLLARAHAGGNTGALENSHYTRFSRGPNSVTWSDHASMAQSLSDFNLISKNLPEAPGWDEFHTQSESWPPTGCIGQ